ncbi:MAG: putative manganese-dependent inorganic diphosphatase [Eubacteriales bacterium]
MNENIFVIGHKNPDTDSICASVAYADFKRLQGVNAVPKRLGAINRETEYVLKHFGVNSPEYLYTVKTQIQDIDIDKAFPVRADTSIKTIWGIMRENNVKTIPIVDTDDSLIGIVTVSNIAGEYINASEKFTIASTNTPVTSIAETLEGEIIFGKPEDFKTTGKVIIAATDPLDLKNFISTGDIVIAGNRQDSQIESIKAGANCLVITCGVRPDNEVLEIAAYTHCIVILTPYDTFTTARLINLSIPVGAIMHTNPILKFNRHDFIDDIREKMIKTRFRSYPVVDDNNKIVGFISRYHLIQKNKKRVILVDHNELAQTVNGIEDAEILEIIDHHRLGDIQTMNPIYLQSEPVGSTSTIIANKYFDRGIIPKKEIAGILCAAILSDTICFKSPTCTEVDKATALKLAEIGDIKDMLALSRQMFKEGSSLIGKTPDELFHQDFKDYVFLDKKIGMGQIFTVEAKLDENIEMEILGYMKELCQQKKYDLLMLFFTDVLESGSLVLCTGELSNLIEKSFDVKIENNAVYLNGIVSRKKQVIPMISNTLESMENLHL